MNRIELENRLIKFAADISSQCRSTESSVFTQHLIVQILRSSSSAALSYGEAQAAESGKDFTHKLRLCLKELKETQVGIKLLKETLVSSVEPWNPILSECSELIKIFNKSLITFSLKNT